MQILANAFSLQMLKSLNADVRVQEINLSEVPATAQSVVGHPDTAAVLTNLLGFEVPANRASVALDEGDELFVAQIMGGRLPEGATTLPENFSMKFLKVTVKYL